MNVPRATLDILKCRACSVQLSRGPVYLKLDGTALCGRCYTPEIHAIRNTHYEALAQLAGFPCKYNDLGCEEFVPFTQGGAAIPHEEVCEYRAWICPVLGSTRCTWLGPRASLLQHCEDKHPDQVLDNICTVEPDVTRSSDKTYILRWLQLLFLLHVKVSMATGKLYHSVRYVGRSDEAKDFIYKLHVKCNNELILKEGEVSPVGFPAQETTSLALDIKGLLSVLGGFAHAKFTVEVQRKICAGCAAQGVLVYRAARGWVCESCAPARRACENQSRGCDHVDINKKCWKHERWFCAQRTQCKVCWKVVERGWLTAQHTTTCWNLHGMGSTWRATRGVKRSLVYGAAGIAVCQYHLGMAGFDLGVYSPVSSDRLREFVCVMCVTQPATGIVRTYTPDTLYDNVFDWHINVKKTDFPSWDLVFDVSVNICSIVGI